MSTLKQDLNRKLSRLDAFEIIIGINILVFLCAFLVTNLFKMLTLSWFELPPEVFAFIKQPWSLFSYGFLHYSFWHIAFNMFILYVITRMTLNLFSVKLNLNVYLLGILAGGLAFLLVYNLMPQSVLKPVGPLVGASAGVRALIVFLSVYWPHKEARFFSITIKLWHIAVAMVVIDVFGLFSLNQGGYVAHLGGDALGYFYATQLRKGIDIGKGFEKLMDNLGRLLKSKSKLKTVHRSSKKTYAGHHKSDFNEFNRQKRIDLILDKIGKSGYESLTEDEKAFLFKAGKD